MRIIALICVFNAAEVIEDCLKSLDRYVDGIYCFDSRWIGVDHPANHSNDGTREIIWDFAKKSKSTIKLFLLESPVHQYEARTLALNHVSEGDWIIIIDSDTIVTMWKLDKKILEESKERGFRICYKYPNQTTTGYLIKKTAGLRFTVDHRFFADNIGLIDPKEFPIIRDIVIDDNHPKSTNKAMRPLMERYKNFLLRWETNAKKTNRYFTQ